MVDEGDMPPEDAKAGPLTKDEKDIIRGWIAAGAPPDERMTQSSQPPGEAEAVRAEQPLFKRLVILTGRFHVLTVHFPIALTLVAALGELWFWWLGSGGVHPAVRFAVHLGAIAGVAAACLGWLHAWNGAGVSEPEMLFIHRWLGTAAAVWLIAVAAISEADARKGMRSAFGRLLLLGGALLVGAAGHFGGLLTHGEDFFNF
jgi:hypothetical protein